MLGNDNEVLVQMWTMLRCLHNWERNSLLHGNFAEFHRAVPVFNTDRLLCEKCGS